MRIKAKAISLLTALILAVTLFGCSEKRINFTMYINEAPVNLDPQVASLSSEITSVLHLFNALFRKAPNGKVSAEAAQDYTVSENGLVYTIKLKEGQYWHSYKKDGEIITPKLTASDYVFGLQRVFMAETKSPYTDALSAIKNSRETLSGSLGVESLGLRAIDELTLEITLSHPDPMFIERLCLPGAMPCNREFFESTNGSYGLSGKTLLSNGRFQIVTWRAKTDIGIKKIGAQSGEINYLRMIVPESSSVKDSTALTRLEDEITNGELVSGSLDDTGFNYTVFSTTSWALVFNCSQKPFNNENIRAALAASAYDANYTVDDNALIKSEGLVPPSITMLDKSYREHAGNTLLQGDAVSLFRTGMSEAGLRKLSNVTVLVPSGEVFAEIFAEINQQWQKDLSVYFSVQEADRASVLQSVESGKYQIALIPLQQRENDVLPVLSRFAKTDNICFFDDAEYRELITRIDSIPRGAERADYYKTAEALLQLKAPIVPLFYETSTYLYTSGISDLVISPYGPVIDITYATQK